MSITGEKVVVAMSGGVDSSVAAGLLARLGNSVTGVFMRLGSPQGVKPPQSDSHKQGCCSIEDSLDARKVAGALGIGFYVLDFAADFTKVISYFAGEYNKGRTPNPCVRCNQWLKFGKLDQYAQSIGARYVATGHYARIDIDPQFNERSLMRGHDLAKDQSYVLFGMTREVLDRTLLPIGDYDKPMVRDMALAMNLPVHDKPDSQEICFVPDNDYIGLLKRLTPNEIKPGEIVDPDGNILGTHPGHQNYTLGQRKGLRVAASKPLYVTHIDPQTNRVTLGDKEQTLSSSLIADEANWISSRVKQAGGDLICTAKIRYNHQPVPARLKLLTDTEFEVHFDQPQSAITPGQAVVLYDKDIVLGGGWIRQAK